MRHDTTPLPRFPGVTRHELATIARNVTEVRLDSGTVLTREGTYSPQVFLIVDGTAEVRLGDQVIATLGAGDVCGELALLGGQRRTATVVATSDVVALVSNPREFAAILADEPRLAARIRRSAAGRLVERRRLAPAG